MTKEDNISKKRHSIAHLLAAAVLKMRPDALPAIGPVIENGFYYDFDFNADLTRKERGLNAERIDDLTDKDLTKLQKTMREILKTWKTFEKIELSEKEAREKFKNNSYKLELIDEIISKKEPLTIYKSGTFEDLCKGGHVESAKEISPDSFKLTRVAGAYWRGDEKNKMLTRIYGVAFPTKKELDEFLKQQEEAEKRDHRKLGKELGLFIFSELVGPGLPIYTWKGAAIRKEIINFTNELQNEIGFQEVHTPNMNKAELFKVSGHYEKYREDMFRVISQYTEEEYFLKPMNCPQHTQVYAAEKRSYRDLPIRISDFANLYRDEKPGQLFGLTRLRAFAQDDGHDFCREDQIKEEFNSILSIMNKALKVYGMNYKIRLSLWDPAHREKYLGDPATWEKSQKILEEILIENKLEYFVGIGEAALYGPKMDLVTKDSIGREWQISTIQLDFIMPKRFELTYTDKDGKEKTPVMIHRAIIGSPERFLGILIEHYAGAFPTWLAPVQVKVVPVRENHNDYAKKIADKLKAENIRAEFADGDEGMGKKIREGKNMKIPYMIVVGDKEVAENAVTVESRDKGNLGQEKIESFLEKIKKEISSRAE